MISLFAAPVDSIQVRSGSFVGIRCYHHLISFPRHSFRLDPMDVDTQQAGVSTHGQRGSRREEWRKSKGLSAHPPRRGMNRQGGLGAKRKAGRSKRRR